jgi:hypothetical protein
VHAHDGRGAGETIATIDSGFTKEADEQFPFDEAKSLDLTGDGLADVTAHGTAITRLIHLVAPRASQYHVKLFANNGSIPGASYDDKVALIAQALAHVEKVGATIVNISWNCLTEWDEHKDDIKPENLCECPVCSVIAGFVKRTDADVFVSEGNYKNTPLGVWSCPAGARLIVPVLGFVDGKPHYDTNIELGNGVPAPGEIGLPSPKSWWPWPSPERKIGGTSFATPLVAGSWAAIKSAFRGNGYDGFELPKNDDPKKTQWNFPVDIFFMPPSDDERLAETRHKAWFVMFMNINQVVDSLYKPEDPESHIKLRIAQHRQSIRAKHLCFLFADLLATLYRAMTWCGPVDPGVMAAQMYARGLAISHEIGEHVVDYANVARARAILQLAEERRQEKRPELRAEIDQLAVFFDRAMSELLAFAPVRIGAAPVTPV